MNPYDTVIYNINGNTYSFDVFNNGKVINEKDLTICETGGRVCLDAWVNSHLL